MSNRVRAKINKKKHFRCPNCKSKQFKASTNLEGTKIYICGQCNRKWKVPNA